MLVYLVSPQKSGNSSMCFLNVCSFKTCPGDGCPWLCPDNCQTQSFHCTCPARSGDSPNVFGPEM